MSAGFFRDNLRNVPITNTIVKAAPPTNRVDIVIGCMLSNKTTSPITVDVYLTLGGQVHYLTRDATLPAGSTLELIEAKLVLASGDELGARASVANSLDIVVSYLRQVQ